MSLTDMVIMPGADYQAACDAIREKTEGVGYIRSGDMAELIRGIKTGAQLPELTNPASASEIANGYEAINAEGAKVTGTAALQQMLNITIANTDASYPYNVSVMYYTPGVESVQTATVKPGTTKTVQIPLGTFVAITHRAPYSDDSYPDCDSDGSYSLLTQGVNDNDRWFQLFFTAEDLTLTPYV